MGGTVVPRLWIVRVSMVVDVTVVIDRIDGKDGCE